MLVPWISSANWAEDQIRSRGAFQRSLRSLKIALIGAGALGSMLAELLARSGANITAIIDGDILAAGNTCRHTITLREVGFAKASSLADRLKAIQPMCQPIAVNEAFPPDKVEWRTVIDHADLIIECTGDDAPLLALKDYPWPNAKRFVSLSLGWKASRLYCFSSHGLYFPAEIYREQYNSWKEVELSARNAEGLTWEGIGCWHPIFPARAEDVMLGAALAVKFIEACVLEDHCDRFQVYSLNPELLKQASQYR
ncbi:MAG: ThiF family adenylyltransferase [Candidatus Zixiibacteriota bacterium]